MSQPHVLLRRAPTVLLLVIAVAVAVTLTGGGPAPAYAAQITAACDNTSTDAATIQNAINNSAAGDEIVIDGPCLINATITLLGNRTYEGQNRTGTVLTQASGANLPAILASDSWVENFSTSGNPIVVRDL